MASFGSKSTAEKVVTDKQITSALHVEVVNATGSPCRSREDGTGSSFDDVVLIKEDHGNNSNETRVVNIAFPDKCYLPYIAPELLTKITKGLDQIELTCLSLTCKALYPLHFDQHRKVALSDYVHVEGRTSQSNTYNQGGTMLANFLTTWVPYHLKYNYEKRKFVTEEKFETFIEDVRDELFLQITAEAPMVYEGLYEDDYEDMVDRYMEEVEDMGFEYEDRPMLEPTLAQEARSERWRRKQRRNRDTRL